MMSEYDGFIRAICENPQDDLVRLVFADWLEENGEESRGGFIRWCVRNRDVEGGITRQPHVHHTDRWGFDAAIPGMKPDRYLYRRGFVVEIRLPLADFLAHAKDLFSAHPIERVTLTDRKPIVGYLWFDGGQRMTCSGSGFRHWLPTCIFEGLPGGRTWISSQDHREYDSSDAANDVLSFACVVHGRKRAGLPPMPEGSAK